MTEQDVTEAQFDETFGAPSGSPMVAIAEVSEAEYDAQFSRSPRPAGQMERDLADFRRVGLPADLAEKAARALKAGTYGTFKEAAIMCAPLAKAYGGSAVRLDRGVLAVVVGERA